MQAAVSSMTMDAAGGLGRLHKPWLLLYGACDALVRPDPAIARARTLKPDAQTMIYADIGHAPFADAFQPGPGAVRRGDGAVNAAARSAGR